MFASEYRKRSVAFTGSSKITSNAFSKNLGINKSHNSPLVTKPSISLEVPIFPPLAPCPFILD